MTRKATCNKLIFVKVIKKYATTHHKMEEKTRGLTIQLKLKLKINLEVQHNPYSLFTIFHALRVDLDHQRVYLLPLLFKSECNVQRNIKMTFYFHMMHK